MKRLHVDPEDVWSIMGRRMPKKSSQVAAYIRVFDARRKDLVRKQAERIKTYADANGLVVNKVWIEYGPGQCLGHTADAIRKERLVLSDFLIQLSRKQYSMVIVDSRCRFHILADEMIIPYFRMSGTELISLNDWYEDPDYMEEQVKEAAVLIESLKRATLRNSAIKDAAIDFHSHGKRTQKQDPPTELEIMANMGAEEPDAPVADDYKALSGWHRPESYEVQGGTLKDWKPSPSTESDEDPDFKDLTGPEEPTTE